MKSHLYVDTHSLFFEVRSFFDFQDRLDFLQLPTLVAQSFEWEEQFPWKSMFAFVVDRPGVGGAFRETLSQFGYRTVVCEQDSQDVSMTMRLTQQLESDPECVLVIVTANRRLAHLQEYYGKERVRLVSCDGVFADPAVIIQGDWLRSSKR